MKSALIQKRVVNIHSLKRSKIIKHTPTQPMLSLRNTTSPAPQEVAMYLPDHIAEFPLEITSVLLVMKIIFIFFFLFSPVMYNSSQTTF